MIINRVNCYVSEPYQFKGSRTIKRDYTVYNYAGRILIKVQTKDEARRLCRKKFKATAVFVPESVRPSLPFPSLIP